MKICCLIRGSPYFQLHGEVLVHPLQSKPLLVVRQNFSRFFSIVPNWAVLNWEQNRALRGNINSTGLVMQMEGNGNAWICREMVCYVELAIWLINGSMPDCTQAFMFGFYCCLFKKKDCHLAFHKGRWRPSHQEVQTTI